MDVLTRVLDTWQEEVASEVDEELSTERGSSDHVAAPAQGPNSDASNATVGLRMLQFIDPSSIVNSAIPSASALPLTIPRKRGPSSSQDVQLNIDHIGFRTSTSNAASIVGPDYHDAGRVVSKISSWRSPCGTPREESIPLLDWHAIPPSPKTFKRTARLLGSPADSRTEARARLGSEDTAANYIQVRAIVEMNMQIIVRYEKIN